MQEMFDVLVHELRTPLNAILGWAILAGVRVMVVEDEEDAETSCTA